MKVKCSMKNVRWGYPIGLPENILADSDERDLSANHYLNKNVSDYPSRNAGIGRNSPFLDGH
jgi:hypothetical protein